MAKNYTEIEAEKIPVRSGESTSKVWTAKNRLIDLIMERVENGSNIDYIVKLSEVYRNIN